MGISELYINGIRVDLPTNFSVRLNRQLLAASALNTKDAQFSYSITLPSTETTNKALRHSGIEETRDKFNRIHTAELIIDGVRIFAGLFKLSSITDREFKGNLYLPAKRSVRDVFPDLVLADAPELRVPFEDFATSVTEANEAAEVEPQPAIYPLALYGLLNKSPLTKDGNAYSARNVFDDTVHLGMTDLPPSLNVLLLIRHLFESQGLAIDGTAFDDPKLVALYMSFSRDPEKGQPWNYGYHAKMSLNGTWDSRTNRRDNAQFWERGIGQSSDPAGFAVYAVDLLDTTNGSVQVTEDTGANIINRLVEDSAGAEWSRTQIRIPVSGVYKIRLQASVKVNEETNWRHTDSATGVQHISGKSSQATNPFQNSGFEVKLLRDRKQGDFGLAGAKLDGRYYYDNQPQNVVFDQENIPKYFPQMNTLNAPLNLIDVSQNRNFLLGAHFGIGAQGGYYPNAERGDVSVFLHPRDASDTWAARMAAKSATSWNVSDNTERPLVALPSPGWQKYGRVGDFDNEGDNPDMDIDFSGADIHLAKILDHNGWPQTPVPGDFTNRTIGYHLHDITGALSPDVGTEVSDYIDIRIYVDLRFSATVSPNPVGAVVVFYDRDLQNIGFMLHAPTSGPPDVYVDEYIVAPPLAAYVRIAADIGTLTIASGNSADENVIMYRFPLQRFYTYRLDAGEDIDAIVYVHQQVGPTPPVLRVPFVNGVAEFDTVWVGIPPEDVPVITMYLKTADYDIEDTLVISRKIEGESTQVIGWEATNRYNISVQNAPATFARRGQFVGVPADAGYNGQTDMSAAIWLEAGELITVASVSAEGRYKREGMHSTYGLIQHRVDWSLSIQPFRTEKTWISVGLNGTGSRTMNWLDPVNFDTDSINLMGFLSDSVKVNDFIENFCKAFNLIITDEGAGRFSLDVKQSQRAVSSRSLDIDAKASLMDRSNTPLGLPSVYKIGFTVADDEQGYVLTGDDGGGTFNTGVVEGGTVEQTSTFSYNWYFELSKTQTGGPVILEVPIISKTDVWDPAMPYPEAMAKRYTNLPYRFWYFDGQLAADFEFNGEPMALAKVSEDMPESILNYKNIDESILRNYFTLLIDGASHYTEVSLYLTPAEYTKLNGAMYVKYNSDLYYIAEIAGYDPTGRNKTTLKLIRKI